MANIFNETTGDLLREAFSGPIGGLEQADTDPAYRAQLALYARTQRAFYIAFETIVLVFAVVTLGALIIFVARVVGGVDAEVLVAGLGTIASGGGAAFLQKQAREAKGNYLEALKLWQDG
jgi:hypothetical protein